jgi:hypothetical protein
MPGVRYTRNRVFSIDKITEIIIARCLLFKQGIVDKLSRTTVQQDKPFHERTLLLIWRIRRESTSKGNNNYSY